MVGFEAGAPVEGAQTRVGAVDFDADGGDSEAIGGELDEVEGLNAEPVSAMGGFDVELVEEREAAGEFETEAESKDEVPDEQAAGLNEPKPAVRGVGEKLLEGAARAGLAIVERLFGVEGPHEGESGFDSVSSKWEESRCHHNSVAE